MYSFAVALAVLAAADGSGVKWVPLNSTQPTPAKPKEAPKPNTQAPPEVAPVVDPGPVATPQSPPTITATGVQQPLHLTCIGGGVASKATGAMVWGYGGWAAVSGKKDRGFNEQVDVRLFNGDDRIRMPRTMLPGIHGGNAGWFKLRDVVADARSIRASVAVNIVNNPKLFIDRVTGTISVSGKAGDYAGQCQVIDASAPAKF